MFKPADLFDLSQTAHAALFEGCEHAWDALKRLREYLQAVLRPARLGHCAAGAWVGPDVFLGEGAVVEDGAVIKGPAWIGRNSTIRHGAYVRECVIVGDDAVVGHACEVKHSVLFNGCEVPHFNYVGDSILGHRAHLGAGAILSNLKLTPGNVTVELDGRPFDTGLRKFGALVGDHAQVGCNAVLNPGSILGRGALVYPGVNWRGVLPAHLIAKNKAAVEVVTRRPRSTL
jgi:NDP-sugar pyrophosphorylase family protein